MKTKYLVQVEKDNQILKEFIFTLNVDNVADALQQIEEYFDETGIIYDVIDYINLSQIEHIELN